MAPKPLHTISIMLGCIIAFSARASWAQKVTDPKPELTSARRIADLLIAGRGDQALITAEKSCKAFPSDPLLRRRYAQALFWSAARIGGEFELIPQSIIFAASFDAGIEWLKADPKIPAGTKAGDIARENQRILIEAASKPETKVFETALRSQATRAPQISEARWESLKQTYAALKKARQLGDRGTELELTQLWLRVETLAWAKELDSVWKAAGGPGSPPALHAAINHAKTLCNQEQVSAELILQDAAKLAKAQNAGVTGMAGAADVLSAVADVAGIANPLYPTIKSLLDHTYLANPAAVIRGAGPAEREAGMQQYRQMREAKDPDAVKAPATLALQLYLRALAADKDFRIPSLRVRVYLLCAAFDPAEADGALGELERKQPRNAVVRFERARRAFLLDNQPAVGMAHCREAARLGEFSRLYLTAVPATIRAALFQRGAFRDLGRTAWPGYECLLDTLQKIQLVQSDPGADAELRLLRVRLAELLCSSPEYPDRITGIQAKTAELRSLLSLPNLPDEQRALIAARAEEHVARYADIPRRRNALTLDSNGLGYSEYPQRGFANSEGPTLLLVSPKTFFLMPGFTKKR